MNCLCTTLSYFSPQREPSTNTPNKDMTISSEFVSWLTPDNPPTAEPPKIGRPAPNTPKITIEAHKRTIVTFLRHCGCPFAEKTFIRIREAAKTHRDIDFIAVSHSSEESTQTWLKSLPQYGSEPGNLSIVVDDKKEAYAAWVSSCNLSRPDVGHSSDGCLRALESQAGPMFSILGLYRVCLHLAKRVSLIARPRVEAGMLTKTTVLSLHLVG